MVAWRIPADGAVMLLVERSQRDNIKRRELATRLVTEIVESDS
jgi:hypothetical protein